MKVLFINAFFRQGSTGSIVASLFSGIQKYGAEAYAVSGFNVPGLPNVYSPLKRESDLNIKLELVKTRLSGYNGFGRTSRTKKICEFITKVQPDVINAHILHGGYLDLRMLLAFIKDKGIPLVLTMHDCWLMTGHCPHFAIYGCDKWKTQCKDCGHLKECEYPKTWFFDRSKRQFDWKRSAFDGLKFHVITPCNWLGSFVPESPILQGALTCRTIYNGTDFYNVAPVQDPEFDSLLARKKKVLLFVSAKLSLSKGIGEIVCLAKILDDRFLIVLVGKPDRGINLSQPNIACLGPQTDKQRLKYIYENSFAFINMTLADTFPTTNIEALQSGIKVITYNTGGCGEIASPGVVYVAAENTPAAMLEAIQEAVNDVTDKKAILEYGKRFSIEKAVSQYYDTFVEISGGKEGRV